MQSVLVIDNGTSKVRSIINSSSIQDLSRGIALKPIEIQNIVGVPRPGLNLPFSMKYCIGEEAKKKRSMLRIMHPMESRFVTNWNYEKLVWNCAIKSTLFGALKEEDVDIKLDIPLMTTENVRNPDSLREEATEIAFESFGVPSYCSVPCLLPELLAISGKMNGSVVSIGDGCTESCSILDGMIISESVTSFQLGGRDLSDYMTRLFSEIGLPFITAEEREIVKNIMEKHCYVSLNFSEELRGESVPSVDYQLPDGTVIQVGSQRFETPEILFQPYLVGLSMHGIAENLYNGVIKGGIDYRNLALRNIVISGGCSKLPGIANRLKYEVEALAPFKSTVNVTASQDGGHEALRGCLMLSSLSSFQKNFFIPKEQYEEHGKSIVHNTCLFQTIDPYSIRSKDDIHVECTKRARVYLSMLESELQRGSLFRNESKAIRKHYADMKFLF